MRQNQHPGLEGKLQGNFSSRFGPPFKVFSDSISPFFKGFSLGMGGCDLGVPSSVCGLRGYRYVQ